MQNISIRTISIVLSVLFIVAGFGMIHNGNATIEYTGSAFIGVPSLYLLILLFKKYFALPDKE